jgi:hypothetical protein
MRIKLDKILIHVVLEICMLSKSMPLMHAKYMHKLCSLLMHIPTYYNVISYYNHVL